MRLAALIIGLIFIYSCNNDPRAKLQNSGMFGEGFTVGTGLMLNDTLPISDSGLVSFSYVSGVVEKYCTGEGCWLVLKTESGQTVKVLTKDKAYVLPRNIDGKKAVAHGEFLPLDPKKDNKLIFEASGILIE
jgi:hypothetical protein